MTEKKSNHASSAASTPRTRVREGHRTQDMTGTSVKGSDIADANAK